VDGVSRLVVASYYFDRRKQHTDARAVPYLELLGILDRSAKRFGFEHVVLTDCRTAEAITEAGLIPFMVDLPQNWMQATTEVHARWLESPHSEGCGTIFVGADCIIRRDFRDELPEGDVALAYMKGHKRWRINNGFMYVPAESRAKVQPLFRLIANDTGVTVGEDMSAIERALVPVPRDYGLAERRGLAVNFLPLEKWNYGYHIAVTDPAEGANVLHFMGDWEDGKRRMIAWAARHGFA
jgi:hypothetical protein